MMDRLTRHLADATATEGLGANLRSAPPGLVVYLHGDLGAGKTTLVRGLLRALGHEGAVPSPTYTLLEPYDVGGRRVLHLDLYRLGDPEELEYLGLRDDLDGSVIMFIEWPERGRGALPKADLDIHLDYAGPMRTATLRAASDAGRRIIAYLANDKAKQ